MPKLIRQNRDSFWFITELDGPWQVYSTVNCSIGQMRSAWGIVNIVTGQHREIGKPTAARSRSKINYYDRSIEKAKALNSEYRNKTMLECSSGYNQQDLREDIISTLNFCTTQPGANCYNEGVPGLVRRLEAITSEVGKTLAALHEKDEKDHAFSGIISAWALKLHKGADIDLRKP